MIRGFSSLPPLPQGGAAQNKQGASVPDFGLLLSNRPAAAAPEAATPPLDTPLPGERAPEVAPRILDAAEEERNDILPSLVVSIDPTANRNPVVGLTAAVDGLAPEGQTRGSCEHVQLDPAADHPSPVIPEPVAPSVAHSNSGDVQRDVSTVPWHLQANSRLSWSSSTGVSTPNVAATVATPVFAAAAASNRPAPSIPMVSTLPMPMMALDVPESTSALLNAAARSTSVARKDPVLDGVATSGWFAAWTAWPERLLRWQSESGGASTAWVRDFRLSAGDAQPLVDSLRDLAGQQGHSLRRIMLNGHEVWRDSPQSEPRG